MENGVLVDGEVGEHGERPPGRELINRKVSEQAFGPSDRCPSCACLLKSCMIVTFMYVYTMIVPNRHMNLL